MQLCNAPSRFRLLRAGERLVDHNQPFGHLPRTAEARSQLEKKHAHVVIGGRAACDTARRLRQVAGRRLKDESGHSLEGGLEELRPCTMIASFDEQIPLEALRPERRELQCMPHREVESEPYVMLDGLEITDKQGDRACRDEQGVQKREQVTLPAGVIDDTLRE